MERGENARKIYLLYIPTYCCLSVNQFNQILALKQFKLATANKTVFNVVPCIYRNPIFRLKVCRRMLREQTDFIKDFSFSDKRKTLWTIFYFCFRLRGFQQIHFL